MINTQATIKAKLAELVGQEVRLDAGDDCADSNGIHISAIGKLEAPEECSNRYYLRIADGYHGCVGIGFHPAQVSEVFKQVYLWQIRLKETLNASAD